VRHFGNLAGETGDVANTGGTATSARVTAADLAAIKRGLGTPRGVTNRFDVNKDGNVNAVDLGAVRANLYASLPLTPTTTTPTSTSASAAVAAPPQPLQTAPVGTGDSDDGVWSRVASQG
jgi:hypothetical protein